MSASATAVRPPTPAPTLAGSSEGSDWTRSEPAFSWRWIRVAGLLAIGGGMILGQLDSETEAQVARGLSNERRAVEHLLALGTAQATYLEADLDLDGFSGYGSLPELAAEWLVHPPLAYGEADGYRFDLQLGTGRQSWWVVASPVAPGASGLLHYYADYRGRVLESTQPLLGPLFGARPADTRRIR